MEIMLFCFTDAAFADGSLKLPDCDVSVGSGQADDIIAFEEEDAQGAVIAWICPL